MASQTTRLAVSIANECTEITYENQMKMCKLPLENNFDFSEASANTVRRYSYGPPNPPGSDRSKTVLLMGGTGSGKTTWINAMINYELGVEWADPFRFRLVDEVLQGGSQAHSQTQDVIVYHLHYRDGFQIPFSLTIVDTPGFGDTEGIERDHKITEAVAKLFRDENGIQELDAVGFVVKSSDARLTPSQSHIFESVIGIFGRDVKENVRFLATFADGKRPPLVLGAIKEAKLACQTDSSGLPCYQKFNNGAIYVSNQDEEDEYSPIDWRNGMKNFKEFFDELSNMPTKSLHLTRELWETANNSARMIYQGATASASAISHMRATLGIIDKICRNLLELKGDVKEFQMKCNFAKTVGTTSNVAGAALGVGGVVMAPFTGGASLVLTVSSLSATAAGVGINLTTDSINRKKTEKYLETINDLLSDLNQRCEELDAILDNYRTAVSGLEQSHGLNEGMSAYIIKKFALDYKRILSVTGSVAAFKAAIDLSRTIEIATSIGTLTTTATGGVSYVITRSMSELTAVELAAINNLGKVVLGRTTAIFRVFTRTMIVVNIGVVVFDIYSLVKDWKRNHPAVEAIDDAIEKLNTAKTEIENNLSIME